MSGVITSPGGTRQNTTFRAGQPQAAVQPNASYNPEIQSLITQFKATHNRLNDKDEETIIRDLITERTTVRNRRALEEDKRRKIPFDQLDSVHRLIADIHQYQTESPELAVAQLDIVKQIVQDYERTLKSDIEANIVLQRNQHVLARLEEEEDRNLASKLPEFVLEHAARASGRNLYNVAAINKIIAATRTSVPLALKMASGAAPGSAPASGTAPVKAGQRRGTQVEMRLLEKIIRFNPAGKNVRDAKDRPLLEIIRAEYAELSCIRSILEDRKMLLMYEYTKLQARRDSFESGKIVVFPGLLDRMMTHQITTLATLQDHEQYLVFNTYADFEHHILSEYSDVTKQMLQLSYRSYFLKRALDGDLNTYLTYRHNQRHPTALVAHTPEVAADLVLLERNKNRTNLVTYNEYIDYLELENEIAP